MGDPTRLRGVVFDDIDTRLAVEVILDQCGFDVVGEATSVENVIGTAADLKPDAMVVDLALSGTLGLEIVPRLLAVAPDAAVLVLSPFAGLHGRALELGARELLDKYDLRPLRSMLHLVRSSPQSRGCTCGLTVYYPSSSVAFAPSLSRLAVPTFRRPPVQPDEPR